MIWVLYVVTNAISFGLGWYFMMTKVRRDLKRTKLWPYFIGLLNEKMGKVSIEAEVHYTYTKEFERLCAQCDGIKEQIKWGSYDD